MWWVQLLNSIVSLLNGGAGGGGGSYESIATVTLSSTAASITFSSIPSTYKDLQIRFLGKGSAAAAGVCAADITINSDAGSNYSYHALNGNGTSATASGSATASLIRFGAMGARANETNNVGVSIIDISDYASTTKYKTVRRIGGADLNGSGQIVLNSGLWQSTSAITSIDFANNDATWASGTTVALYGIKGA